ncbi:TIR domain-containing protein [Weissella paramesenteroides]|uniref:TIR domain-containing protein n=1 Tax=Weissella paramesenteroides TaxID=1249 RepID=UPI003F7456FD
MHKTFISYHHSGEQDLKDELIDHANMGEYFIDKSVSDGDIDPSLSEETIMRKLREDFIKDSSVIVVLIGEQTADRPFVNSEIQAGLWGQSPVGLIGVVRDDLYDRIYDKDLCSVPGCNCGITLRRRTSLFYEKVPFLIRKNNAILENNKSAFPHYSDSEAYCGIYRYSNFFENVEKYVDEAFEKRNKVFDIKKTNDSDVQTINNTHG